MDRTFFANEHRHRLLFACDMTKKFAFKIWRIASLVFTRLDLQNRDPSAQVERVCTGYSAACVDGACDGVKIHYMLRALLTLETISQTLDILHNEVINSQMQDSYSSICLWWSFDLMISFIIWVCRFWVTYNLDCIYSPVVVVAVYSCCLQKHVQVYYRAISTSNLAKYECTSGDMRYFRRPAKIINDLDFLRSVASVCGIGLVNELSDIL